MSGKFCKNTGKTVKKMQKIKISNIYPKQSSDTRIYSLVLSSSRFIARAKSEIGNAFNFVVTDFWMSPIEA